MFHKAKQGCLDFEINKISTQITQKTIMTQLSNFVQTAIGQKFNFI